MPKNILTNVLRTHVNNLVKVQQCKKKQTTPTTKRYDPPNSEKQLYKYLLQNPHTRSDARHIKKYLGSKYNLTFSFPMLIKTLQNQIQPGTRCKIISWYLCMQMNLPAFVVYIYEENRTVLDALSTNLAAHNLCKLCYTIYD